MKTLQQIATVAGFKSTKVTAEELEDGIGVTVGQNWIKDQVWYTTKQMTEELGLTYQAKSQALDLNLRDTEAALISFLKSEKAEWYHVEDMRSLSRNQTKCAFIYGSL